MDATHARQRRSWEGVQFCLASRNHPRCDRDRLLEAMERLRVLARGAVQLAKLVKSGKSHYGSPYGGQPPYGTPYDNAYGNKPSPYRPPPSI